MEPIIQLPLMKMAIEERIYNHIGQLTDSCNTHDICTHYDYDGAGRQYRVIQNYVDGVFNLPDHQMKTSFNSLPTTMPAV